MKIFHNKKFLIIVFLLITFLGISLPGVLLHFTFSSKLDSVNKVSANMYNTSNSAISRNASLKLSEYERMKLISGSWASTQKEVDASLSNISEVEAVELARKAVSKLYSANGYPYHFNSSYDNWYTWKTQCYQCIETSFQTYSAYYWKVSFYRYDTDEVHEVLITENGTLLAIRNNIPQDTLANLSSSWITCMKNYYKNQYPFTENRTFLEDENTENLSVYENIALEQPKTISSHIIILNNPDITNLSDFNAMVNSQIPDDTEIYNLYQCSNDEYFLICFIPWE